MNGLRAAGSKKLASLRTVARDGACWPLAQPSDLAWITEQTVVGLTITSAIPPVYEAYGTVVEPDEGRAVTAIHGQEQHLVDILQRHGSTSWWLGFIDGGEDEQLKPLFPHTKRIGLYAGWPYVVVLAGPSQALAWGPFLPDLIVPTDRSWCLSTLWDDSWTCIGGPAALIDELTADKLVQLMPVSLDQDATPPGHTAI